jgi:hypothetical protein
MRDMSLNEPRFLPRGLLRRAAVDPGRPDDSEPEFSSWAAKLDDFIPARSTPKVDGAVAVDVDVAVAEAEKPGGLRDDLEKILAFDGAMCVALVDSESGMVLGQAGSGIDIERAAAGASMILRARRGTIKALGILDEIDDLLVTLSTQLQIIRPLSRNPTVFIYLIVDKSKASLGMARYKVAEADGHINL